MYRSLSLIYIFLLGVHLSVQTTTAFSQKIFSSNSLKKDKPAYFKSGFITNIGQYGNLMTGYENLKGIKYGYEGFNTGFVYTQWAYLLAA